MQILIHAGYHTKFQLRRSSFFASQFNGFRAGDINILPLTEGIIERIANGKISTRPKPKEAEKI